MSAPLPLYPGAQPCVGSGQCCRTAACPFGTWDATRHQCIELMENQDGTTACRKYEEILARPKDQWWMAPAFGAGCCQPLFNEAREAILKRGRSPWQKNDESGPKNLPREDPKRST